MSKPVDRNEGGLIVLPGAITLTRGRLPRRTPSGRPSAGTLRSIVLVFAAVVPLLVIGCAASKPAPPRPAPNPSQPPPLPAWTAMPQADVGLLPVFVTEQTSDGHTIHLRGLVGNPYPEPVEGVRVIVRILLAPRTDAEEVDRFQKEYRTHINSGDRVALRLDVRTPYAAAEGTGGLFLQAFAIKRGGQYLPLPVDWR